MVWIAYAALYLIIGTGVRQWIPCHHKMTIQKPFSYWTKVPEKDSSGKWIDVDEFVTYAGEYCRPQRIDKISIIPFPFRRCRHTGTFKNGDIDTCEHTIYQKPHWTVMANGLRV